MPTPNTEPGWRARVYEVVRAIPRGKVLGYGHVAAMLDAPRKARHVGYALAALDPGDDVPWWRVLRSSGHIAFRGDPVRGPLQRRLLEGEGVVFKGERVPMETHRWEPW